MRSARFAGPDATDAQNLARLRWPRSPAGSRLRYVCVIAHVRPDGSEQLFEGRCEGRLSPRPGGARGFGYDPVFLPGRPAGRPHDGGAHDAEKDAISHRGRAARALLDWLRGG